MLTLIYAYYDNPDMLKLHIDTWRAYPDKIKKRMNIILVDDCSPRSPAIHFLPLLVGLGIPTRIYRVLEDIPWNLDGARNLGMKETETEWNLITDMDRLLPVDAAAAALEMTKERGKVYRPDQVWAGENRSLGRPHPNSFIIHRSDYWQVGGYDEDFQGSYGTDGNFRKNLRAVAVEVYTTMPYLLCCEDLVKDSITQTLPRKVKGVYCVTIPRLKAKLQSPPYVAVNPIRFRWERQL